MSGLLALLDDVAAIAKLAATSVDDITAQAAKAGAKAAGVVVDDAAVTPKYVTGLPAAREIPIVWKIAKGSFFNKLVILTPAALVLDAFLPWVIVPLLMLGGAFLCYEGGEKIWHALFPHDHTVDDPGPVDPEHLEETRVKGAIKTDFILSAEIMTIALSSIETESFLTTAVALIVVGIGITVLVYGAVALLVKADDFGIKLMMQGTSNVVRSLGSGIVHAMPGVLVAISVIGTAAMLWVGGSIVIHGLHEFGLHWPYEPIKYAGEFAFGAVAAAQGFVKWLVMAFLDGVFGIVVGLMLIPLIHKVAIPAWQQIRGGSAS